MKSPLGPYGSLAATVISVMIVAAAVIEHVTIIMLRLTNVADPFLDTMATAVIGIVLGVQVATNGSTATSTAALIAAQAAHTRLDEIKAPPASQ